MDNRAKKDFLLQISQVVAARGYETKSAVSQSNDTRSVDSLSHGSNNSDSSSSEHGSYKKDWIRRHSSVMNQLALSMGFEAPKYVIDESGCVVAISEYNASSVVSAHDVAEQLIDIIIMTAMKNIFNSDDAVPVKDDSTKSVESSLEDSSDPSPALSTEVHAQVDETQSISPVVSAMFTPSKSADVIDVKPTKPGGCCVMM